MPRQSGPKSTFKRKLLILNRMTALSRFCGTISKPFKSFQNRCARPIRAALECGPEATDQRDNSHVGQHATDHCPPALLAHPYTTFSNCGVGVLGSMPSSFQGRAPVALYYWARRPISQRVKRVKVSVEVLVPI